MHRALIVPVSGSTNGSATRHISNLAIRQPDQSPLAFAGLWGAWHDLDTFTIVTTNADADMQVIHDRMPLIPHPSRSSGSTRTTRP